MKKQYISPIVEEIGTLRETTKGLPWGCSRDGLGNRVPNLSCGWI
ncbi:lasso RiPP family leader peptide-containing protein [Arthrobacter sp. UYCu712]